MNLSTKLLFFIGGLFIGGILTVTLFDSGASDSAEQVSDEKKPLYWVAPMDSNYRRDKPGKSPMGMDLIPVYEESDSGSYGPGAIKISPEVVNNLGVRLAKVDKQELKSEIKTVGYVNYDEGLLSHIHPRVEGWIEKLYIKAEGDPLVKGQPLYDLYSPSLVSAQEEFLLALSRKNNQLIRAARSRLQALQIPQNFIQSLQKNRQVSQTITFYSPRDGFVDNLNIRKGFFVKPGTMLMSIGELKRVWVEAEIFERQVSFVKVGMPVEMQLDYLPGKNWQGKVDYIYPKLDAKTRTVKLRSIFENQDNFLKPNMFAQVIIHGKTDRESLIVPKPAVIRTGRQDRVVVALEEGRFKSVEVKLGMQNESFVEILSGLEEEDNVVVSAQFLIDSESSKTSDFMRMSPLESAAESIWVSAEIKAINSAQRQVTASHEAIDEWQWPPMTMDFQLADVVEIDSLYAGLNLHLQISKQGDDHVISDIHVMDDSQASVSSASVKGKINSVDKQKRLVNISRGPIEKWNRPAATMDFFVTEEIDLGQFSATQQIEFTFEIRDGDFVIVAVTDEFSTSSIDNE